MMPPYSQKMFLILMLFSLFSCSDYIESKKKEFREAIACKINCEYKNSIRDKFVGQWYVQGKAGVKGIRYVGSPVEAVWEFSEDGLIYNVYGDTKILRSCLKIIDESNLEMAYGEKYKYSIDDNTFTLVGSSKYNFLQFAGEKIK